MIFEVTRWKKKERLGSEVQVVILMHRRKSEAGEGKLYKAIHLLLLVG